MPVYLSISILLIGTCTTQLFHTSLNKNESKGCQGLKDKDLFICSFPYPLGGGRHRTALPVDVEKTPVVTEFEVSTDLQ